VVGATGTVMVCVRDPPSDQLPNKYCVPGVPGWGVTAEIV